MFLFALRMFAMFLFATMMFAMFSFTMVMFAIFLFATKKFAMFLFATMMCAMSTSNLPYAMSPVNPVNLAEVFAERRIKHKIN